jgi:lipoyl synthase
MSARPAWLRVGARTNADFVRLASEFKKQGLSTVCQESICPNLWECFSRRDATFLILGSTCSRACGYCRLSAGRPEAPDESEPFRLAASVAALRLKSVVITSVTRDDLPDGGSGMFAAVVRAVRAAAPDCRIELLIPDFSGDRQALDQVVEARPDVIGHNIEVVPELFPLVRPEGSYKRSLEALRRLSETGIPVKSGLMVGLGETRAQIRRALRDIAGSGVDTVTIGQYLQPSARHAALVRYYRPAEFVGLAKYAAGLGFHRVLSGPLVRSSYRGQPNPSS